MASLPARRSRLRTRCRSDHRPADRLARFARHAPGRAALVRPLPDRGARARGRGLRNRRHPARLRLHRRLPGLPGAGQLPAAARGGRPRLRRGLGWIAQIGLFVLLGLLAAPSRLLAQIGPALAIGLVLLLVARPLSVFASVSWFGVPIRQQLFLSWAGLRGAVPVVLATVPVAAGVEGSSRLFDLVFVLVVIFTLVQAPTLPGWPSGSAERCDDDRRPGRGVVPARRSGRRCPGGARRAALPVARC